MLKYPKPESSEKFFQHTESQEGDVVLKILAAKMVLGREAGGFAAKRENADMEHFIYKVQTRDGKQKLWTVKAKSQVGGELARKNVQPGDMIKVHYLGQIMPTDYGNKAKYEILKKGEKPTPVQTVTKEDVEDVFEDDVAPEDPAEEVSIEDFD